VNGSCATMESSDQSYKDLFESGKEAGQGSPSFLIQARIEVSLALGS
jgi:hypothetical protein